MEFPITQEFSIEVKVDKLPDDQLKAGFYYVLTLDPCKQNFFEQISTKKPFPFKTQEANDIVY